MTVAPSAAGTVTSTGAMVSLGGSQAGHITVSGQSGVANTVTVPTGNFGMTGTGALIFGSITASPTAGTFSTAAESIYVGGTVTSNDASTALYGAYSYSFPVTIACN